MLCATHRDLKSAVHQGTFREDLLFRLRGLAVTLPPLRMRSDIRAIIASLLRCEALRAGHPFFIDEEAVSMLLSLPWPGNIRELKQALGAAASMSENHHITVRDVQDSLHGIGTDAGCAASVEPQVRLRNTNDAADAHFERGELLEREELLSVLRRHRWNISRAAHETNAARTTIYRRMSRLNIVPPNLRGL